MEPDGKSAFEPNVADVKRLTEETGRYMLDCKQALASTRGDYKMAKQLLSRRK